MSPLEITVKGAQNAKRTLESTLLAAIQTFEVETGMTVRSVDLETVHRMASPSYTMLVKVTVVL